MSDDYDEPVDGSDVVQWLGENAEDIRVIIDGWDMRSFIPI